MAEIDAQLTHDFNRCKTGTGPALAQDVKLALAAAQRGVPRRTPRAAQCGVGFIDLKEPGDGALGGLPIATLRSIVDALRRQGIGPGALNGWHCASSAVQFRRWLLCQWLRHGSIPRTRSMRRDSVLVSGARVDGRIDEPLPRSGNGIGASSGWVFIRRFFGVPFRKLFPLTRATKRRMYGEKRCASEQLEGGNGTTDVCSSAFVHLNVTVSHSHHHP
jgi:hypothetical protein